MSPLFVLALALGCLGTVVNHNVAVLPMAIVLLYVLTALVLQRGRCRVLSRWTLVPGVMWACFLMHVAWGSAFWSGC